MPRAKCEYCSARIPHRQLQLHLKRCVNARRALKKQVGFAKIEDPSELAPQQEEVTEELTTQSTEQPVEVETESEVETKEEPIQEVTEQPVEVETAGKKKKKR